MSERVSRTRISKTMAYLLRHDPEGMSVDSEGFALVSGLLEQLSERDIHIDRDRLREVVEHDPKGRYELQGEQIRARYGHSIDVEPTLEQANVDVLYHGTKPAVVEKIMNEGLTSQGRQKVHLSRTVDDAMEVGGRHTNKPVLLRVDAAGAQQSGVRIERASDRIFVADHVPPQFVERHKKES